MKKIYLLTGLLCCVGIVAAQTSVQDFGTATFSQTSSTGSTAVIPNPTSGTTWARGGATAPNAPVNGLTTSNPLGTTGAYARGTASASTSVTKFSPIAGYTGSTEFYTSFKVLFGDVSAGSTATTGAWSFFQGAGAMYTDANNFSSAQVFTGLVFTYGAGGAIALSYRNGGSASTAGLTTTSFNSATIYTVEIVGNNKSSGTISYSYNGTASTVAVQKFDLYVNGVLVGDDLAAATFSGTGVNINSTTFIGVSSTSNAANVFVDDVKVYNAVPATIGVSGTPTIVATPATLSGYTALSGVASLEQSYAVSGTSLTNDISITPPTGFEISTGTGGSFVPTNPITLTQSGGVVAATNIYTRLKSTTLGVNTGNVVNASTGATSQNVTLTGHVIDAEPTIQSAITFGTVTNSTIAVNFSGGNGQKRILVVKANIPVDSDPADGVTYTASATYGSGTQLGTGNYVVYAGTGNSVTVTGLNYGTSYNFAVYEYNDGGVAGAENYLTPGGIGDMATISVPVVYIWTGGNGAWTTSTNWTPIRLFPAANDILEFLDGSTETVTGVPNETIGQIAFSLNTNVTLQGAASTNTLTIGGLPLGTDFTIAAGSHLSLDGPNVITMNIASGSTAAIDGTMALTGGAHKLTAADVSGVTFNSGATFTAGTGFTGNPFGASTIAANSVVFTSGSTFIHGAGSNPFALTQPNSIVVFQSGSLYKISAASIIPSLSGRTYANFELDAPTANIPATTAASPVSFDTVTVTNGIMNFGLAGTGIINIKGNLAVKAGGTLNFIPATTGTLIFNGAVAQNISNLGVLSFNANQNITINNTSASGITLSSPITALGVVTFTSGLVNTTGTNRLILDAAATVAGASNASYVNGPVTKIGDVDFTFPTGKAGAGYVPVGVSNYGGTLNSATDAFTAEYIHSSAAALGPVTDVSTDHVSGCDYWKLDRTSGSQSASVTAYWSTNNTCGGPYITDLTTVILVHFNGTSWNLSSYGMGGVIGGSTTTAGSYTWSAVNTFSPFALGSISSGTNPLPVTINYFKGNKQSSGNVLDWKIDAISTAMVTISLERSSDDRSYAGIYTTTATDNSITAPYTYVDNKPAAGINYYRLKITDAAGRIAYSTIVVLVNDGKAALEIVNIAPNPTYNGNFKLNIASTQQTQMDIVIADMQGRVVSRKTVTIFAGANAIPMTENRLASGVYQLFGITTAGKTKTISFIKQ